MLLLIAPAPRTPMPSSPLPALALMCLDWQQASPLLLRLCTRGGTTRAAAAAPRLTAPIYVGGGRCWREYSAAPAHHLHPFSLRRRALSTGPGSSSGSSDAGTAASTREDEAEKGEGGIMKDQWGNRGKLIYEGSIAHHVRGLKR